jgi:hypothetical protein
MIFIHKTYCLLLFAEILLLVHPALKAQETPKPVTRRIEKSFEYNGHGQIIIDAERGNIRIQSWDRNEISVVLTLEVKNKDPEQARRELEYMHYNLVKNRGNVFLNNKMVLPDAGKNNELSSIIWARYEIRIPETADMLINNKFGQVTVKNAAGKIHGELQYSDMLLQDYRGDIHMNISVGDLTCLQSQIAGDIRTRHANVTVNEVFGKLSLQTDYGSLKLAYGEKPMVLDLISYATDILIGNRDCHSLELRINASYCPLSISRDCYTPAWKFLESDYQPAVEQSAWHLQYLPPVKSVRLKIDARFGTLNLL